MDRQPAREGHERPRDTEWGRSERRPFLQSLAAVGALTALPAEAAAAGSQETLDDYHRTLREDLTDGEGLPAGEFVYGVTEATTVDRFTLQGGDRASETQFDVVADAPITLADRVEIDENPENPYAYTYKSDITDGSVAVGDVLLAVAYVRGAGTPDPATSEEVQCEFKYRYTDPDGNTAFSQTFVQGTANVSPGSEWRRYYFPIEITEIPDGTDLVPYLEFWTGFREQTVEIGGVALVDYGQSVSVEDLPRTEFDYDYPGRAEDAAWREAAHRRIDDLRKTDFEVTVVGPDGEPVEGAAVDVAMRSHDFGFGTAVAVNQLPDGDETYRETLLADFNKAVPENGLKVPAWEGRYGSSLGPESTRAALSWLEDHGIPTRGHALVWATYDWMGIDSSLSAGAIDEEVRRLIRERAAAFAGELPEWDVHNHPLFYSEITDDIGRDAMLGWWATAHDAAPDARMYVNEMNVLAGDALRQQYHDLVGWLQDEGAGVEGIGFMGHFDLGGLTPPAELLSTFDEFATYGVPLQITEFDVRINDRSRDNEVAAQRDYVRDVLTAAFSHEAVEGVMSWGFWADEHWRPTAAYYGSDWTRRPHGEAYRRLVFEEWWTDVSGETDADGTVSDRGFKGTYEVTAVDGELFGRTTATFDDDGATGTVELSPVSIGDLDLAASRQALSGDETARIAVSLTAEDGTELPVPDGALTFESSDPDAIAVDGDGVVSAAGTGEATVTATVEAYGDTAVGSAAFVAGGEPAIVDPAEDFSLVASSQGMHVTTFEERHGDGARFEKDAAGASGSVTYHVPGGVGSFSTVAYVNYQEVDGTDDVFEDLVFETSADGDSFETVPVESTVAVPASEDNGYYALWRYEAASGIPGDATYLRVTIPETQDTWSVNVGEVVVRSDGSGGGDRGEPTIADPAEDFSLAVASDGLHVTTYQQRHDDGARFEKDAAGASGSVTYRVPEGIGSFRTVAYVNYMEIDGDGDVFEDLVFEVSADGESFERVEAASETTVPASGENGYYALWTYDVTAGIPDDAAYLRVTIPETEATWSVNVGEVEIWAGGSDDGDATGPSIVATDLQSGRTYRAPHPASVAVADDESAVAERSITLDGEVWSGGEITARGAHTLAASATSADGVTTAAELDFAITHATRVAVTDRQGEPGEATAIVAELTNAVTGEPLAGRTLEFRADGEVIYAASTDDEGRVEVSRGTVFGEAPPSGGSLELTVSWAGEEYLLATETTETIRAGNGNGRGDGNGN